MSDSLMAVGYACRLCGHAVCSCWTGADALPDVSAVAAVAAGVERDRNFVRALAATGPGAEHKEDASAVGLIAVTEKAAERVTRRPQSPPEGAAGEVRMSIQLSSLEHLVQSPGQAALREGERLTAVLEASLRMHAASLRVVAALRDAGPHFDTYRSELAWRHAVKTAEREAAARYLAALDADLALSDALATGRARLSHGGGQ